MSFMRGSIIDKTKKFVKAKILPAKPLWLKAVTKFPPPADYLPRKAPGEIIRDEDPYVRALCKRHREFRVKAPYDSSYFEPRPARRYARRWMELIKIGFAKERALEIVDAEYLNDCRWKSRLYEQESIHSSEEGSDLYFLGNFRRRNQIFKEEDGQVEAIVGAHYNHNDDDDGDEDGEEEEHS